MKIRIVLSLIVVCLVQTGFAQSPVVRKLSKADLAARAVAYKGRVVNSLSWADNNGENLIILTQTNLVVNKDEDDRRDQELYAYHYANKNGATYQLLRKIYDFTKGCPVDITLQHVAQSLTVTDLDKNGYAEVTFLYTNGCRGDVSNDELKLMMLENGQKYAIRGTTMLYRNGEPVEGYNEGASKTVDVAFNKAPTVLLNYANKQWNKFKIVNM